MKHLAIIILLLCVACSFTGNKQEQAHVYYYYNPEDTDVGSLVIVCASSYEKAVLMFTEELANFGLTFEPTNVVESVNPIATEDFIIYSDSGDYY